jgi:hypothetical protein
MRESLAALLLVIIFAFVGAGAFGLFSKFFISFDQHFADSATGAFLGAFLAFLFVRIGDFFKSYSERVTKSHSSLVQLEHLLNSVMGVLDDNVHTIEIFQEIYSKYQASSSNFTFVWANRMKPVPLMTDLLTGPTNIDLVNELFRLNTSIRKINDSMETMNGAYTESKDALICGKIDVGNYMTNVTRIHGTLIQLKGFLEEAIEETIETLAAIRVLAKNRPVIGYLLHRLPGRRYDARFEKKRIEEETKLRSEIEEIKRESKSRIDKVLAGGKNAS